MFPFLTLMVFLPLVGAGWVAYLSGPRMARYLALAIALVELVLATGVVAQFDFGSDKFQLVERVPWIPSLGISYAVGLDGLSALMPLVTTALTATVILATWTSVQRLVPLYLAMLLVLETATLGVFCALDLVLFFLFWELTLVPAFFLLSLWGSGPQRRAAAVRYVMLMLAGGVPLLFGILLLALNRAEQMSLPIPAGLSFDYLTLLFVPTGEHARTGIFLLLILGFGVKVPLVPLHSWLPSIAVEGPAGALALLVGMKLGLYGIVRFALPLVPEAAQQHAGLLAVAGVAGLVYGALVALRQTNLRALLAYSSVSHAGLVLIAVAALNTQGLQGAIFQLLNLGIVTGGMFLLAGFLHHRLGSTDLVHLGGVAGPMPWLTVMLFVLGLASMGVPGTSGFGAEHLMLFGIFQRYPGGGLAALGSVVLGAAYWLIFFQAAFFGPTRTQCSSDGMDLRPRELAVAGFLVALVIGLGLVPSLVARTSEAAVSAWVARVTADFTPTAYAGLPRRPVF